MKRFFAILLIFLFLALPVLAEEQINLSTPGADLLTPYTLPDGQLGVVFTNSLDQTTVGYYYIDNQSCARYDICFVTIDIADYLK